MHALSICIYGQNVYLSVLYDNTLLAYKKVNNLIEHRDKNKSYYIHEIIENSAYNLEFVVSESMILCIDYVSNGIESNSCETVVFEKYHFVHITAYYVYRQNLHKYIKLV